MRTISFLFFILGLLTTKAIAEDEPKTERDTSLNREIEHYLGDRRHEIKEKNGPAVSLTSTIEIWSKYLLAVGIVGSKDPVIQTDWFLTLPKGFYLDLWTSNGVDGNLNGGFDDEVDFTVGWSGPIPNFGGWKVDMGLAYFALVDLSEIAGDILEPYLKVRTPNLERGRHTLYGFAKTERLIVHHQPKNDGWQSHLGGAHSWKISEKLALNSEVSLVHDSGIYQGEDGFIARGVFRIAWRVGDKLTVNIVNLKGTVPLSVHDRDPEIAFGLGLSWNF